MKSGFLKWVIGSGVIGISLAVFSQLNFGDSLVYFYVPSEAVPQAEKLADKNIKVGAMVKKGSVDWKAKDLDLSFVITDYNGHEISVRHKGLKPDMFKEGQGVVVEGRIAADGKSFEARTLMVKHSEEYKKPDSKNASVETELLKKSIFSN